MSTRRDPIAVVEACYNLSAPEPEWLQGIADAAALVVRPTDPLIAYHVEVDEQGPHFPVYVQANERTHVYDRIHSMAELLERKRQGCASLLERLQAKVYARVVRGGMREPVSALLISETKQLGPKWMYTLGVPGVCDVFHLRCHHIDGNGLTVLAAGIGDDRKLRPPEREMYKMLSAHIKAGLRLRRKLGAHVREVAAPMDGAVLDASTRVVHADGEAKDRGVIEALQSMAAQIDRARTQASGRDELALEVWQGLIDGRWSLVEQFDRDGKRFMLAHRNPENVADPRGLSDMETRTMRLAIHGYSNKLIAYHLGVAESTASSHLARAMAKLKIGSRVDLVRLLGVDPPGDVH